MSAWFKSMIAVMLVAMTLTSVGSHEAEARDRRYVGAAVAAGVAGLVIGGALAASAQPRYYGYQPAYQYYQPQPRHYYAQPRYYGYQQPVYYQRPPTYYTYAAPAPVRVYHQPRYYQPVVHYAPRVYRPVDYRRVDYRPVTYRAPRYRTACNTERYIDRRGRVIVERTCREVRVR